MPEFKRSAERIPKHDPNQKTYSDAMAQWAASRDADLSVWGRFKNRYFNLASQTSIGSKIFSLFWRLSALALVAFVVWFFAVQMHLQSGTFKSEIETGVAKMVNASAIEANQFRWTNSRLKSPSITLTGGPSAFFRQATLENVDIELPLVNMLRKDWGNPSVSAADLIVDFKSGTGGTDSPAPSKPKTAGLGVSPDFSVLKFSSFQSPKSTLKWGTSSATRGKIENSQVVLTEAANGVWALGCRQGTLTQNWINKLPIRQLYAEVAGDVVQFSKSSFFGDIKLPELSGATIDGTVKIGPMPVCDLTFKCTGMPSSYFIEGELGNWVSLLFDGEIKVGGSVNLVTGVTTEASWKIREAVIRGLPILSNLAVATTRSRLRTIDINTGVIEFKTTHVRAGVSRLEITKLDLRGPTDVPDLVDAGKLNAIVIRGNFAWEAGTYSGTIRLGVPPEFINRLKPSVRSKYFKAGEDGLEWIEIPMEGTQDQLTKGFAEQLASDYQKSMRES